MKNMRSITISLYYIYIITFFLLSACQSDSSSSNGPTNKATASTSNIKLIPCPKLDSADSNAKISMETYTYTDGKAMFGPRGIRLGGKTANYNQRKSHISRKGNHVHLNIDNKEHAISNENVFEYHIADGKHKFFGFICRNSFESIKKPNAIIAKEVIIRGGKLAKSNNLPMVDIVYNVPRGLYKKEDSDKILLDFVLVNTEIAPDANKVRVTIDETAIFELDTWQAHYIEGLSIGEHDVLLELLDATGRQIAAPVGHKFVLTEKPSDS